MAPLLFDEISVGLVMASPKAHEITRDEIIQFAGRFDPQPFHLDEEAATRTDFGGLVASGLHTLAVSNRLGCDETPGTAAVAGLGIDALRLLHPVRPGDRLRQTTEIIEVRPSRSRRDRGIVRARRATRNQDDVLVLTYLLTWMVARDDGATA